LAPAAVGSVFSLADASPGAALKAAARALGLHATILAHAALTNTMPSSRSELVAALACFEPLALPALIDPDEFPHEEVKIRTPCFFVCLGRPKIHPCHFFFLSSLSPLFVREGCIFMLLFFFLVFFLCYLYPFPSVFPLNSYSLIFIEYDTCSIQNFPHQLIFFSFTLARSSTKKKVTLLFLAELRLSAPDTPAHEAALRAADACLSSLAAAAAAAEAEASDCEGNENALLAPLWRLEAVELQFKGVLVREKEKDSFFTLFSLPLYVMHTHNTHTTLICPCYYFIFQEKSI